MNPPGESLYKKWGYIHVVIMQTAVVVGKRMTTIVTVPSSVVFVPVLVLEVLLDWI